MRRVAVCVLSLLLIVVLVQAFRGGIHGIVTSQSGVALDRAAVTAVHELTGLGYEVRSSTSGEFAFEDLPLGDYSITVSQAGFEPVKISGVGVSPRSIRNLAVKLATARNSK